MQWKGEVFCRLVGYVQKTYKIGINAAPFPFMDRLLEKPQPASWGFSLSGVCSPSASRSDAMTCIVALQKLKMTLSSMLSLVSSAFGVLGTLMLFKGSYALEPFQGATFGSDAVNARNAEIRAKNKKRIQLQKVGLSFILIGFFLSGVAQFF